MEKEDFEMKKIMREELHKELREKGKVSHNGWIFEFKDSRSYVVITNPSGETWEEFDGFELDQALKECVDRC